MSYAALLALLAALAFVLPFLARLAENIGFSRSYGILATLALGLVALSYAWLRWRLRQDDAAQPSGLEPGALPSEPYVPGFLFEDGVFRGEQLLEQGQRQDALRVYRAYQAILNRQGQAQPEVDAVVAELEEDQRAGL